MSNLLRDLAVIVLIYLVFTILSWASKVGGIIFFVLAMAGLAAWVYERTRKAEEADEAKRSELPSIRRWSKPDWSAAAARLRELRSR